MNHWFENDVKMYGIQTEWWCNKKPGKFENDVKMYGIQTSSNNGTYSAWV